MADIKSNFLHGVRLVHLRHYLGKQDVRWEQTFLNVYMYINPYHCQINSLEMTELRSGFSS